MKNTLMSLVAVLFTVLAAQAQLGLKVDPVKRDLIPGEMAELDITVINNTGRDIELKSVNNTPWLSVNVVNATGTELPNIGALKIPPLSLKSGQASKTRVNVSRLYDLSHEGMFRAYVVVTNPIDNRNYMSNKAHLNFHPGVNVWSTTVGIPKGMPGSGNTCRYTLLTTTIKGETNLHVKIEEVETGRIIRASWLGRWLRFNSKPTARIDSSNRLHVLFLNTSDGYVHSMVDTSGNFAKNRFYKRSDTVSASLVQDGRGGVIVQGAIPYDPKAPVDPIKSGGDLPF